jgi:flagellar biogenesis protein FliO
MASYAQTSSDKNEIIDLTTNTVNNNPIPREFNVANIVALLVIVILLVGIFVLVKLISKNTKAQNKSIEVIDRLNLDSKVTIYVLKIYGDIVKVAVGKNTVAYLGSVSNENIAKEFFQLVNGEKDDTNGKAKIDTTAAYMKVMNDLTEIGKKIEQWKKMDK